MKKALSMKPLAIILVSSLFKNEEAVPQETLIVMVDRYVKGFPENSVFASFDYERADVRLPGNVFRTGTPTLRCCVRISVLPAIGISSRGLLRRWKMKSVIVKCWRHRHP